MKKIFTLLLTLLLCVSFVGCAEVVNTETEVVTATIADADRDPVRLIGRVTHPADYDILLKYEDIEEWVDVSSSTYSEYKELIGTTIEVNLITTYYDDGTQQQWLEFIEE